MIRDLSSLAAFTKQHHMPMLLLIARSFTASFCVLFLLQISGWHVVGAALESPNSFRVWYFSPPDKPEPSSAAAPPFKLHKTLPFVCSSGTEASSVVQRVRQCAAWHSKDKPPRVVAIINPHSGRGK